MLTIRKEQLSALKKPELQRFVDHAVIHVKEFFPTQFAKLGEAKLREDISYGIERAARYKITSKADVLKYIDFMVICGRDFDSSPQLRWASEILNSENSTPTRIEMLTARVKKHMKGS